MIAKSSIIRIRSLTILSFVLIFILSILYVIQINQVTRTRFEVSGHKKEIARFSKENKNLEIYYSQTNSLASLDSLLENSDYVRVDSIRYIQILDETVAIK